MSKLQFVKSNSNSIQDQPPTKHYVESGFGRLLGTIDCKVSSISEYELETANAPFLADELRQIADKLDELNGGHNEQK